MPKTVAIIQARMGSSRLPGKVLKTLMGKTVLWHICQRLAQCNHLDQIVVATSILPEDDCIANFCQEEGVSCFRGLELDVLDRYFQTAKQFQADHIVRITGDCPVIDPVIVDEVIDFYFSQGFDYSGLSGEFPNGLDCEIFSFEALKVAWEEAKLPSEREHVTPYFKAHPKRFQSKGYEKYRGMWNMRWTLDEPEDYELLSRLYDALYQPGKLFLTDDILSLLNKKPHLLEINNRITRNEGYLKSIEADQAIHNAEPSNH